jgi:formamidopyrimidine-DNA glycosylase
MPELPEVSICKNTYVEHIQTLDGLKYNYNMKSDKQYKVKSVYNIGKHIFFALEDGLYMHSRLAMEGQWHLNKIYNTKGNCHARLFIYFIKNKINNKSFRLYYDDKRNFGDFEIMNTAEYSAYISKLGQDLLRDTTITVDSYHSTFNAIRIRGLRRSI